MIQRNLKILKWDNFFAGLWPLSTLVIIYFQQITGSYATAMAVFSISSLTTTVMEIPTGIVSDKIGRRKTLISAAICVFTCFLLWALAGQFSQIWMLFLGALCWGISGAIVSGTDEALIYETMEELDRVNEFDIIYSKSRGWNQIGLAISALSATIITYFFSLQVLAWISLFPVLGQIVTSWLYVEPQRTKKYYHKTTIKHFLIAFRRLLRNRKLKFYATIEMIDTAVGFSSFRFESAYYETLIATWAINLARFLKQICGTISFFIIPFVKKFGSIRLFFASMIGTTFVKLTGLILNNALTPFIMSLNNLFFGTGSTAGANIFQKEFSSSQRATMKSIISFGTGILMAFALYMFGILADSATPRFAMFMAVLIKIILLIVSLGILNKAKKKPNI